MNNHCEPATDIEEPTGQANSATVLLLAWVPTNITLFFPLMVLSMHLTFGPVDPLAIHNWPYLFNLFSIPVGAWLFLRAFSRLRACEGLGGFDGLFARAALTWLLWLAFQVSLLLPLFPVLSLSFLYMWGSHLREIYPRPPRWPFLTQR